MRTAVGTLPDMYSSKRYGEIKEHPLRMKELRRNAGLREIRHGNRDCLRCSRDFFSSDLALQYMCDPCRDRAKGIHLHE